MRYVNGRPELIDAIGIEGRDCVEVGVLRGDFSHEILLRNPRTLALVDCWTPQDKALYDDPANLSAREFEEIYSHVLARFDENIKAGQVGVIPQFSCIAAQNFPHKVDVVYIDACHNYEEVLCDLCCWSVNINPGGWLCGHDFTGKYTGVKRAVETFCRISKRDISILTSEAEWASYGIQL